MNTALSFPEVAETERKRDLYERWRPINEVYGVNFFTGVPSFPGRD
jgi:hypothetical protein